MRCPVRVLWALLVLVFVFGMSVSGCGEPKPLDNSKFDKAAYDVNAGGKALSEDKTVTQ